MITNASFSFLDAAIQLASNSLCYGRLEILVCCHDNLFKTPCSVGTKVRFLKESRTINEVQMIFRSIVGSYVYEYA